MIEKIKNNCFYLVLCFTIASCTEVYEPKVETGKNIIYIQGGISNMPGPYTVTLQYAQGYGSTASIAKVTGAEVFLFEDNQLLDQFLEIHPGEYQCNLHGSSGKPEKKYSIQINAPDGNRYESQAQIMPQVLEPLDSVYGISEIKKIKYYNVYGDFILKEQEVVQLYADIPVGNQNTFSRFECRSILEYIAGVVVNPGTSSANNIPLFLWESYYSDELNILEVNSALNSIQKFPVAYTINDKESYSTLKEKHLENIEDVYDSVPSGVVKDTVYSDTSFVIVDSVVYGVPVQLHQNTYYTGWILHISQCAITKEAYMFWSDIKKLEESDGELFDPITTQLRGNMTCTTDPGKIMIGFFEVSAETVTPAFINFDPTEGNYLSKKLNIIDNIPGNGWSDTIPPAFWIDKLIAY